MTNVVLDARRHKRAEVIEATRMDGARGQETVNWLRSELHAEAVTFLEAAFNISDSRRLAGLSENPVGHSPMETRRHLAAES